MASRTVLVTGANRGLGAEVARQLARDGDHVVVTSRDASGRTVADAIVAAGGSAAHRALDVADDASVAALARSLADDGVVVDVLVNNAGIALDGFDADVARKTVDVNFYGPLRVTDALLPRMPDGSTIVMVSSGMGELSGVAPPLRQRFADPALTREELVALEEEFVADVVAGNHRARGWPSSAYRVSKIGLIALTKQYARALAPRRIRVNAVCPGWVRTDMGGPGASRDLPTGGASIAWAARLVDDTTGGFFRDGRPARW